MLVLMVMSFDLLRVWVFDTSYYFREDNFFKNFIWGQFGFDAVPLTLGLETLFAVRADQIRASFNPMLSLCH